MFDHIIQRLLCDAIKRQLRFAGKASFVPEAEGPWLLAVTELRPGAAKPSEWESDFATLYLTVAP